MCRTPPSSPPRGAAPSDQRPLGPAAAPAQRADAAPGGHRPELADLVAADAGGCQADRHARPDRTPGAYPRNRHRARAWTPGSPGAPGTAGPDRPRSSTPAKAAMGAAASRRQDHDDQPPQHRPRAAPRRVLDRLAPQRTPALRPPPLPGRTRHQAHARRAPGRDGAGRHLRRPGVRPHRHAHGARPRKPALVHRQPVPPRRRPGGTRTGQQRAGAEAEPEGPGRLGDPSSWSGCWPRAQPSSSAATPSR